MPNLSENELRALAYYAIGVGTEGGDTAYQLSFCGQSIHQVGVLEPIGNSGYSIGEMQIDLGANHDIASRLVDSFEEWARANHPDWMLNDSKAQFASKLGRDGNHIRDTNYTIDELQYQQEHPHHHLPSYQLPATGQDIDQTFKDHINTYLASDAGKNFVHLQDIRQVGRLIDNVAARLNNTDIYKNSSPEDQARLFAVVGKMYNQGPRFGDAILDGLERGQLKSYVDIANEISTFLPKDLKHPDRLTYLESGRDAAVKGAEVFNALQSASIRNPIHDSWQIVVGDPLVDPSKLGQDANQPHLPDQYATVKSTFVQPEQGRAFVSALESGISHNYGDPSNSHSRGFFSEGRDFVQWDRDGNGRAFVDGQWSEFSRSELSLARNADHTLNLNVTRNGETLSMLHVTHPTDRVHAAADHAVAHAHGAVLRQGMHGDDVQKLQAQLGELGYLDNTGTPDGKFGSITRDAVKAFQHDHHLAPNGRAGASTQHAIQDSLQPLKQDQTTTAPAITSSATNAPGIDDPRNPANPNHALFNDLKQRFPDASENRLLQFTAACHVEDINERNLQTVIVDHEKGLVGLGSGGWIPGTAIVDVKQPAPQAEQSIQQIQHYDQQQAINQAQSHAQQAHVGQQQGPVR